MSERPWTVCRQGEADRHEPWTIELNREILIDYLTGNLTSFNTYYMCMGVRVCMCVLRSVDSDVFSENDYLLLDTLLKYWIHSKMFNSFKNLLKLNNIQNNFTFHLKNEITIELKTN